MQGTKFNESPVFFLKKEGRKNIHNEIKSKKKNCNIEYRALHSK